MSAVVIPPGGTIVQTFKRTFDNVTLDADKNNAVNTTEFLEAAESLTTIFGIYLLPWKLRSQTKFLIGSC